MPTIDDILAKQSEKTFTREIVFATDNIQTVDNDTRTVTVAFSSEEPVDRWFGKEILDHSPESVDLTRLTTGGPVLVGHDMDDQVGVIESAHIDADRRGRAVLRFGRSQRATDIFNDVTDGIRQKISVGYMVHEYVENVDEGEFRATKWEPLEVSFVSVPADNTVGVGRSVESKIEKPEVIKMTEKVETPAVDMDAIRAQAAQEARGVEQKRTADINAIGKRYGLEQDASEFLQSDKSVEEFREIALEKVASRQAEAPKTELDLSKKEVEQYSLMRAINAMTTGNWDKAGFEREASIEIAERLGRDSKGFFVPLEIQGRAQNTQVSTAGGALVGTDHIGGSFIDLLRARSVVIGLGANMLTGLVGNVDIPKQTGGSTVYWVAENEDVTNSEATFGTVALAPRTMGAAVPITRRMMKQSDPSIDAMLMNGMSIEMALALDDAILEGTGVNRPLGIANVTGVNTQSVSSAGAPTWAEIVGFESAVAADNALTGNMAYVTTPTVAGTMKVTAKDSGSGLFLNEGGMVNGYPVATTSQLTANEIIFGNFADVVIGNWGVLEIIEDKSTNAASGGTVIRAFQDVDAAVRHAESFCVTA